MDNNAFAGQREDLLQSMEEDREGVRVALQELTSAAGFKLDMSERVKESPLTWAFGAFLMGVWLGGRTTPVDAIGQRRS